MKLITVITLGLHNSVLIHCIVDGVPSRAKSWMVYLHSKKLRCGGTPYRKNLIITAARCNKFKLSDWHAHMNRTMVDLDLERDTSSVYSIINRTDHPEYKQGYGHDISLWRTNSSSTERTIVDLDTGTESELWGSKVKVLGWGGTRRASPYYDPDFARGVEASPILLEASIPLVNEATCEKDFFFLFDKRWMICTGYSKDGPNVCNGDAGGPVYREIDNRVVLIGVINNNLGCGVSNFYSMHTKISDKSVTNFILSHANNK